MSGRIASSKVSADFLHANSTNHTWAFSAFAELTDNACDAKAREVQIDMINLDDQVCLSFQDDGKGMDKDQLYNMLSFGFCIRHLSGSIGKYGNGFKSGSMRLGKDAIVFTRTRETAGVGLLSQTYNSNRDTVLVPMLHYSLPDLMHDEDETHRENLAAILEHSMFEDEEKLRKQLRQLPKAGTQIIIYNLHRTRDDSYLELDFDTHSDDIRCPEIYDAGSQHTSDYKISLKEYLSILYLHPRMKIKLRGNYVKTRLIAKSLCNTQVDEYVPKGVTSSTSSSSSQQEDQYPHTGHTNKITFGFVPGSGQSEDYGMMLYSDNRLIKPYEQVQCQRRGDGVGARVVGVTQAKFLTPTNMKQDFIRDTKYMSAMKAYNTKLKNYWDNTRDQPSSSTRTRFPDSTWAQCDYKTCLKWRRLPPGTNPAALPDKWYCYMHPDHITCALPEDMHEDEDIIRPPSRSRLIPTGKQVFKLSELLGGKRSRRENSPMSVDSDSVSSDRPTRLRSTVGKARSSTSQNTHSTAPNSSHVKVSKRAVRGSHQTTNQVNSQRAVTGSSHKKTNQVNSQRAVTGSSHKKTNQVNSQRAVTGSSHKKTNQVNSQRAVTGSSHKKTNQVNRQRAVTGSSHKKTNQVNRQRAVTGSSHKKKNQVNSQRAVRSSTRQKTNQVNGSETENETLTSAGRGVVRESSCSDDGSNHEDNMDSSVEEGQGPGDDAEVTVEGGQGPGHDAQVTVEEGQGPGHDAEVTVEGGQGPGHDAEVTVEGGQGPGHDAEVTVEGGQGPGHDAQVTVEDEIDSEDVVGLSAAVIHSGDDASDMPVDAEPRGDANSSVNDDADGAASCSSMQPRNELSQLQSEIESLRSRFDHLLNNCRRLLQKLAPDIQIDPDMDIEQLIVHMLEH